ncbi:MAG: hypothetical protein NT019_02875 [Candidatus Adlerbacteria bacterium]|nr:hypothetical protein [Candidatus Adlerbacteria bacterium]
MTHHAYLYEGPVSLLPQLAESACAQFNFQRENNPDVYVREWEKFGIDEARELTQQAALKAADGRALFVLGLSSITSEAQHALLKLFEEPVQGTIFVLLVPHGALLSTLRSRFLEYPEKLEQKAGSGEAKEFLSWPYKKRSDWVTVFVKNDEENTRELARSFLNELEAVLYKKLGAAELVLKKEIREGLQDIAHFRDYLSDRAPSLKMILEHFAATLPLIK